MSPQSTWHTAAIANVQDVGKRSSTADSNGCEIQAHSTSGHPRIPIRPSRSWRVRVANGRHRTSFPIALLVEVSDGTLSEDRNRKTSLYAASNIADYWIVNLQDRQLEVRRVPVPDASEPFGYRYDSLTILLPDEFVTAIALPTAQVAVIDLMPN